MHTSSISPTNIIDRYQNGNSYGSRVGGLVPSMFMVVSSKTHVHPVYQVRHKLSDPEYHVVCIGPGLYYCRLSTNCFQ